jgi:hypothetical protein
LLLPSGAQVGFCHVMQFASAKGDLVAHMPSCCAHVVGADEEWKARWATIAALKWIP